MKWNWMALNKNTLFNLRVQVIVPAEQHKFTTTPHNYKFPFLSW